MSQLDKFMNFSVDGATFDELVELSAFARQLRSEYETLRLDEPEWVSIQTSTIRREIGVRGEDARQARIREINSRLASLKTNEEKKTDLLRELERLSGKTSA